MARALGDPSVKQAYVYETPPRGRSAVLNRAEAEGVISGYRAVAVKPSIGEYRDEVGGGKIAINRQACGMSTHCFSSMLRPHG
jgi:hypothetical protein